VNGQTAGARSVRSLACGAVERILAGTGTSEGILESGRRHFEVRDRALFDQLTLGSIRWLLRLDHVLEAASRRPISQIDEALRAPLRVGAYQLLFLDRVPAHAAVDEAVEETRRRGLAHATGFVNGVLRRIARTPSLDAWPVRQGDAVHRLAVEQSHPEWLVRRWCDRFGLDRTRDLLVTNNRPRPATVLTFEDRGGRAAAQQALAAEGVEGEPSPISPLGLVVRAGRVFETDLFAAGSVYVQDAASQLAAWLPVPQAGEKILDLAAAPGGKTFSLIAWEPSVAVTAADRELSRLLVLRENLRRLRRTATLLASDAARPGLRPVHDRIVLDLPCSGTGTFRKHPELKWRLTPRFLEEMTRRGTELVTAAAACVRPGGLLCVITCSIEPEENEDVIAAARSALPELAAFDLAGRVPATAEEGLFDAGAWRLLPAGDHDGFTVHVLQRRD
jgi:16S rRNA (cytosine967-C5)-methyltransferase